MPVIGDSDRWLYWKGGNQWSARSRRSQPGWTSMMRSYNSMKMSVIGCGHLGATHAACMASIGHDVIGVDIDGDKVALLNSGKGWFHEPDLDPMLAEAIAAGRLRFTTDFAEAAEFAAVHFLGVATPGH